MKMSARTARIARQGRLPWREAPLEEAHQVVAVSDFLDEVAKRGQEEMVRRRLFAGGLTLSELDAAR